MTELDKTKDIYHSLQQQLEFLFDSLARDKINLELQMIEAKKFKLAVENASDQIVITDPDGVIIYTNPIIERVTGYKPMEVLGKMPGDVWGGKMTKEYYTKLWDIIKTKKEIFLGEVNNVRKNGEVYTAASSISPVLDEKGEIMFFIGIERDITKEKEVERMKNEFIGLASHQLRTPLTGIRWFAELMLRNKEANLTPQQLDFLNQIYLSNQRMIKLVNELLDISHIETGRKFEIVKKDFLIKEAVEEILTENIALIKSKELNIANQLTPDLSVFADYVKIKQVLLNIISNATKYCQDKKTVTIGFTERPEKNDRIYFVKDEGIGVPEAQKDRLFEKFFRADNAVVQDPNGTGLGLYIAREICRAHGGEMWFESTEGQGTTFFFSLPLKDKVINQ